VPFSVAARASQHPRTSAKIAIKTTRLIRSSQTLVRSSGIERAVIELSSGRGEQSGGGRNQQPSYDFQLKEMSDGTEIVDEMSTEPRPLVSHDSLVLVGDGQKAIFSRNRGNAQHVDLVVERILERDNPPTREQGTDRPGRTTASPGVARSAMEEVDWHYLAKERFAGELAEALYRHAHANQFERLVIVAPPKILGNLRKAFHAEVADRIAAEIPKELTSHPVSEIERLIAA
jgi:protein required for attachment to host cells